MSYPRIIFPFTRLTDTSFLKKARCILAAVTVNPYFIKPSPTVSELEAAMHLLEKEIAESAAGNRSKKYNERNDARIALEEMLVKLAVYVMHVAGGDRKVIISSGFDLAE
jgi:hypothetical protein